MIWDNSDFEYMSIHHSNKNLKPEEQKKVPIEPEPTFQKIISNGISEVNKIQHDYIIGMFVCGGFIVLLFLVQTIMYIINNIK